jgi:DNA-binding MarR family transcriptional regulator
MSAVPVASDPAITPAHSDEVAARLVELTQSLNRFRAGVHAAVPGESEGSMYHLLFQVLANGPMRAAELAGTTQSDPSTVSRQVSTLVGRGLLERRADPQDGRASLLHGTEAGAAFRDRLIAKRNEHFREILAGWSELDRRRFASLLGRFTDDFTRYKDTCAAAFTTDQAENRKASA